MKHVAFVGLGYIGLPTAVVMANSGLKVTGVDVLPEKVESINRGDLPLTEPGLVEELNTALQSGNFCASTEMPAADVYIIAVPTPFTEERDIDMSYIHSAVDAIAPKLSGSELIILESTSSPRTTAIMGQRIVDQRPDLQLHSDEQPDNSQGFYVAHCPERILPGQALSELRSNDRIIGGMSKEATRRAKEIYASFCTGELLETDSTTAELAKLTENSFRDVNIAFANELSMICDELGINVWELIELANHHPRVNILQPGPGVGGHCIAVDPWFIVSTSPKLATLVRTAREVNDSKPSWVLQKISNALANETPGKTVALLGLTFKPNVDDLRQAPALEIAVEACNKHTGHEFIVVEPHIDSLPDRLAGLKNTRLGATDEAIQEADILVLLVKHDEFADLDVSGFGPEQIIDTQGAWAGL